MLTTIIKFRCPDIPDTSDFVYNNIYERVHTLVAQVCEIVNSGKSECAEIILMTEEKFNKTGAPICTGCGKNMVEKDRRQVETD